MHIYIYICMYIGIRATAHADTRFLHTDYICMYTGIRARAQLPFGVQALCPRLSARHKQSDARLVVWHAILRLGSVCSLCARSVYLDEPFQPVGQKRLHLSFDTLISWLMQSFDVDRCVVCVLRVHLSSNTLIWWLMQFFDLNWCVVCVSCACARVLWRSAFGVPSFMFSAYIHITKYTFVNIHVCARVLTCLESSAHTCTFIHV